VGWFVHPLAAMSGTGRSQLAAMSVDWSAKSTVGLVGPESGWPRTSGTGRSGDGGDVGGTSWRPRRWDGRSTWGGDVGGPVGDEAGGTVQVGVQSGTGRRSRRWTGRSTGWPFRMTGNRSVQKLAAMSGDPSEDSTVAGRGPALAPDVGGTGRRHIDGGLVGPICWRRSRLEGDPDGVPVGHEEARTATDGRRQS
jgi:hypothetical protein